MTNEEIRMAIDFTGMVAIAIFAEYWRIRYQRDSDNGNP